MESPWDLHSDIYKSAATCFGTEISKSHPDWMRAHTWELVEKTRHLRALNRIEEERKMKKRMRKCLRQDWNLKIQKMLNEINEADVLEKDYRKVYNLINRICGTSSAKKIG